MQIDFFMTTQYLCFNVSLGVLSDVADLDGLKEGVQINVHGKLLKTAEQQNNQSRIVAQNIERLHLDFFLKLKDHKGQEISECINEVTI